MPTPLFTQRRAQRGVSMLFALMTLVVLALAAVALVRSIDTSSLVAGNLGFKQDATAASGRATELAFAYLTPLAGGSTLDADSASDGYYSTSLENLDVTGGMTSSANPMAVVDWSGNNCADIDAANRGACIQPSSEQTVSGSTVKVRWVITRLCSATGPVQAGNPCSRPQSTTVSNASERGDLSSPRLDVTVSSPYYRVIVRALGARNTVSYTESIVHF